MYLLDGCRRTLLRLVKYTRLSLLERRSSVQCGFAWLDPKPSLLNAHSITLRSSLYWHRALSSLARASQDADFVQKSHTIYDDKPNGGDVVQVDGGNGLVDPGILSYSPKLTPVPFKLRPFQVDCANACMNAIQEGYNRIACLDELTSSSLLNTSASGKTAIFTSLIERLPSIIDPRTGTVAHRVLVLVGTIELALQAAHSIKSRYPYMSVEIEQGARNVATGKADVCIATYQTLARGEEAVRLQKFSPIDYKAIIVDEAHHAAAPSYIRILQHFDPRISDQVAHASLEDSIPSQAIIGKNADGSLSSDGSADCVEPSSVQGQSDQNGRICVPILGFSATLQRADGLGLGKVFQKIVWHADWLDMVRGKWLSDLRFTTVQIGDAMDFSKVKTNLSGDFSTRSLGRMMMQEEICEKAILSYLDNAQSCRSTLVFAVNIEHIYKIANTFREHGIRAEVLHEGVGADRRKALLKDFKDGAFPVLVNCGILTEGADIPSIDCIMLARPTRSQNLFLQMIGRGLRLSPDTGKRDCLVLDLVGSSARDVFCVPTLFGINPAAPLKDKSVDELLQLKEVLPMIEEEDPDEFDETAFRNDLLYKHYSSIFDLVDEQGKCTPTVCILNLVGNSYLKIHQEPGDDDWQLLLYKNVEESLGDRAKQYWRPITLGKHLNIKNLLRFADAYVSNQLHLSEKLISKFAQWRRRPSSAAQQVFIVNKIVPKGQGKHNSDSASENMKEPSIRGIWIGRSPNDMVPVKELTRGEADMAILKMTHGFMGLWRKADAKVLSEQVRESKRRKDEAVLRARVTSRLLRKDRTDKHI